MPEAATAPKQSFVDKFAATRPATKAELEAANAAPVTPPPVTTPPPAETPKPPVEPAKPQATAPAAPDPDEEIVAGKRTPKNEDFKRVKHAATEASKQRDELKAKTAEYEKELGELRKAPKHNAELIAKIERERDEYKTKFEQVAVEFTPEFNAKYENGINAAIDRVKDALPADRAEKIKQLLRVPDGEWKRKMMAELTEDLDPFTTAEIVAANGRVRDILNERQSAITKAGETLNAIGAERQKKQEERKAELARTFDAEIDRAKEKNPIFQPKEGDSPEVKAWNDAVAERTRVARAVFMDQFESAAEKAEAGIWAASAPGFLEAWKSSQAEVAQLKETLAKLQSASPNITSTEAKGGEKPRGGFAQKMAERSL